MIEATLAASLVDESYVQQAEDAKQTSSKRVRQLLQSRRLPESGWSDFAIERLLLELSAMDSNNHENNVGAGEREGRVYCELVRRRHWGLAHGIGRSGDVAAIQPKAAGSSLLCRITEGLIRHALQLCQVRAPAPLRPAGKLSTTLQSPIAVGHSPSSSSSSASPSSSSSSSLGQHPSSGSRKLHVIALPTATGLTITLALLALRAQLGPERNLVVWPRIDQKSCLKAVLAAGLTPVVVENLLEGDELRTDVEGIRSVLAEQLSRVLAVFTTTSCFAPRGVDRLVEVAELCQAFGVHHLVNNAYGLQSSRIGELLSESFRKGRLDLVVQSTDKNFLVPVGGAIVFSTEKSLIDQVSRVYPGRASVSPIVDLFATLLSMGAKGFQQLLAERKALFVHLRDQLAAVAKKHGERLLHTPNNPISVGMTLGNFDALPGGPSHIGSMLYRRCCSGHRVVLPTKTGNVDAHSFVGYGAHHSSYPVPYLTAACAIGMKREEIDIFIVRLDRTLAEAQSLLKKTNLLNK